MKGHPSGTSKNLLRVADFVCDARCTLVQLRFSTKSAAARDGFSKPPLLGYLGLRCCGCTALRLRWAALAEHDNAFIAAHNRHYTVLLKSVHGTRQYVRKPMGYPPIV
jgi:hypothetical protein